MLAKSKRGLTNGLKPQISRENRGEINPGKSGLFGADWDFPGSIGAFPGPGGQFLRNSH